MAGTIFFHSWQELFRIVLIGSLTYAALIALLRISGKRTLTKLNAFDLVVTVALGSTVATVLLSRDVALAEGIVALALLIGLQALVAWTTVRSPFLRELVKSEPRLLLLRGELLEDAMRSERISRDEVFSAIRSSGYDSPAQIAAVVLETDGSISVIASFSDGNADSAIAAARGFSSHSASRRN